jgi:hypothetical protein
MESLRAADAKQGSMTSSRSARLASGSPLLVISRVVHETFNSINFPMLRCNKTFCTLDCVSFWAELNNE